MQTFIKVKQSRNVFQKRTNEFGFFAEQYYDQIVSFVFWKNSRIGKTPFEINWPLTVAAQQQKLSFIAITALLKYNELY